MANVESVLVSPLQSVTYVPKTQVLSLQSGNLLGFEAILIRGKLAATAEHVEIQLSLPELTKGVHLHINIPASAASVKLRISCPDSRMIFDITACAESVIFLASVATVEFTGSPGFLAINANIPISPGIGRAEEWMEDIQTELCVNEMASRRMVDVDNPANVQLVNIPAYPELVHIAASSGYSNIPTALCANIAEGHNPASSSRNLIVTTHLEYVLCSI